MKMKSLLLVSALGCIAIAAPAWSAGPVRAPDDTTAKAAPAATAGSSDAAVTQRVKAAIGSTPGLGSLGIHVTTVGGVVRLTGSVPSGVQVDQAQDITTRVRGVKEVNNLLQPKTDS
jgi:osmotically-inducible protein OsmY